MKMASQDRETQMQNPMLVLDALYCEEEDLGECDLDEGSESVMGPLISSENYFDCEDNELMGLLMVARREAVDWMLRVVAHYGFTVVTSVLAVNYFDGFVSSLQFQRDKPWMSQLAAVACLSLAAKVEETQVPLLLDLQVEESKCVFEAKTIQRMELLVLSTLEWKMNPITPLSFVDYVLRRLRLKTPLQLEFLRRCERLLLSVITDSSFVCYLPSVLAAAIMLHVIKEIGPYNALDCQNELLDVLKMSRDKVDDCYKLIVELPRNHHKRRYRSIPNSPDGVIDAYLSCDSSNDSWAVASRISSSPEPMFKKSRVHEQQMRLAPLRHMCVGVVGSPH
ncbi:similar to CYCLIN D3;3 [Actinidia rufa]|uniref:Similar to CYCLIN D33 n=1 Tax=Actinidia rufa TaxID=165716 RepID=A0A7J0H6Q0_9ERIC|nr:similar to CYCLIN D3;3 [Actinidia rufa]